MVGYRADVVPGVAGVDRNTRLVWTVHVGPVVVSPSHWDPHDHKGYVVTAL